jgi:GDPmannose 4,6-dehydratase
MPIGQPFNHRAGYAARVPARRALITGIGGQDGSYLAELLVEKGYEVVGMVRQGLDAPQPNLDSVRNQISLLQGELRDAASLRAVVTEAAPDELYHLGAPTFVPASWEDPTEAVSAIAAGTATLLACARERGFRLYVAASSEIFGDAGESPQREGSPMRPSSPYGVAKLAALGLVGVMRERQGVHASCGILYNHESPRRPLHFLPRKVTRGAAAVALGEQETLALGSLKPVRDWCHAHDVARAAWLMLQQDEPGDYVIASGVGRTVGELVEAAFAAAGVSSEGRIVVDSAFVRPPETTPPVGDPSLARERLGWEPEIGFETMIAAMVAADLAALAG